MNSCQQLDMVTFSYSNPLLKVIAPTEVLLKAISPADFLPFA